MADGPLSSPPAGGTNGPTFGPYPGDALAPPPTQPAPEIPMESGWLWLAGAAIVARYVLVGFAVLIAALVVLALLLHRI